MTKGTEVHPTEPLRCRAEAERIREDYYRDYAEARRSGGLRWAGGARSFDAVPMGLGDDVHALTGEPYGASIALDPEFARECQRAVDKAGFARDLGPHMRNYWGSVLLDRYAFGGPFPKPDFAWQIHAFSSHAKWYQVAGELAGGVPTYSVDVAVGPARELTKNRVDYIYRQLRDGIPWLERTTGRKFDDERFIRAVYDECRATSLWAEICCLNRTVPAPLDEESLHALSLPGALNKASRRVADFYEKVRDEVKDRVERGVAAVPTERRRVMSDTPAPQPLEGLSRHLGKFGCVSVGSLHAYGLFGAWDVDRNGEWVPRKTPQDRGVELEDRNEALRYLVEWTLHRPEWQQFHGPRVRSEMMIRMAREWKIDGVLLHSSRDSDGLGLGVAESRAALQEAGFPVVSFEGDRSDDREPDGERARARVDAFMETLGLERLEG